jgi:hypothetical protein
MIEFSAVEVTIGKRAINKSHSYEITSGKITIIKLTGFKFFEVHLLLTICGVLVSQIKEISCHNLMEKYLLTGLHIQQSSALKKQKIQKQFQASLIILTGL